MRPIQLKKLVDRYGRQEMSKLLSMPYGTLSGKLNGYIAFTAEEVKKIRVILTRRPAEGIGETEAEHI